MKQKPAMRGDATALRDNLAGLIEPMLGNAGAFVKLRSRAVDPNKKRVIGR